MISGQNFSSQFKKKKVFSVFLADLSYLSPSSGPQLNDDITVRSLLFSLFNDKTIQVWHAGPWAGRTSAGLGSATCNIPQPEATLQPRKYYLNSLLFDLNILPLLFFTLNKCLIDT